jgi:hypothetical protein
MNADTTTSTTARMYGRKGGGKWHKVSSDPSHRAECNQRTVATTTSTTEPEQARCAKCFPTTLAEYLSNAEAQQAARDHKAREADRARQLLRDQLEAEAAANRERTGGAEPVWRVKVTLHNTATGRTASEYRQVETSWRQAAYEDASRYGRKKERQFGRDWQLVGVSCPVMLNPLAGRRYLLPSNADETIMEQINREIREEAGDQ